jgi:hypothetical protein
MGAFGCFDELDQLGVQRSEVVDAIQKCVSAGGKNCAALSAKVKQCNENSYGDAQQVRGCPKRLPIRKARSRDPDPVGQHQSSSINILI